MRADTIFRWPSDGSAYLTLQDALEELGRERSVSELIPLLQGRAALLCWLVLEGATADDVQRDLAINRAQLELACGMALATIHVDLHETIICSQIGG